MPHRGPVGTYDEGSLRHVALANTGTGIQARTWRTGPIEVMP